MKKIVIVSGLIAVLFALNYAIDHTLSPKPLWLDVAVHTSGGQLAALLCGFIFERFSCWFVWGKGWYKFLMMVMGGMTLGALLEVAEVCDAVFNVPPILSQDTSYGNLVQGLAVDFIGAIIGAFTYIAWNLKERGKNICH